MSGNQNTNNYPVYPNFFTDGNGIRWTIWNGRIHYATQATNWQWHEAYPNQVTVPGQKQQEQQHPQQNNQQAQPVVVNGNGGGVHYQQQPPQGNIPVYDAQGNFLHWHNEANVGSPAPSSTGSSTGSNDALIQAANGVPCPNCHWVTGWRHAHGNDPGQDCPNCGRGAGSAQ